LAAGTGPRTFIVDGNYLYLVGELNGTLNVLKLENNVISFVKSYPLIDEAGNQPSHIKFDSTKQFIYVANRGPNSISVF